MRRNTRLDRSYELSPLCKLEGKHNRRLERNRGAEKGESPMAHVSPNTASLAESYGLGALRKQYGTDTTIGMGCFITLGIMFAGLVAVLIVTHSSPYELLLVSAVIGVVLWGQYQSSRSYEQVDIYERGFIASLKGKGFQIVRWQDIKRVSVHDVYRGGRQVYVSLHNGKQLILHGTISRFNELCELLQDYTPQDAL